MSFDAECGHVHALVGENGAGKSTLVKIVTGILAPNAGRIELLGEPVRFETPAAARRADHDVKETALGRPALRQAQQARRLDAE